MAEGPNSVFVHGFFYLVVSQISTRLITFFLNLLTARLLTIDAYGLASIQFHLINTFILFLSREGFRKGCLRAQQSSASPSHISRNVLAVAALTLPLGALTSLCTCGVALRGNSSWTDAYAYAIYLQGMAAMVELLSEPLYILAQLHLKLQLRVFAEAAATLARGIATLTLLKSSSLDVGIALSVAQCIYAAVTLIVYMGGMAKDWPHLSSRENATTARTDRKPEQATPAAPAQLQKAEGAEVARQAPQPPMTRPAAGSQTHGIDDDEDWELLHASASPDASSEASLAQCSPDDEPDLLPRADALSSDSQQDAQERSAAGALGQAPIPAVKLSSDAQHSSSGKQHGGVDMRPETGGQSLIHPRSASAAAQLNETLEAEASNSQDRYFAGTKGGQASGEHGAMQPLKAGKHEKSSKAEQQQRPASQAAASGIAKQPQFDRREVLWRCAIFTLQAATKLLLAEGSKVVMVACQSSFSQGIYGLVSNLGSLVVRTIFQPFEEAAFLAFSQREPGLSQEAARRKQARELSIAVRCVSIVGLLAVAFGPAYTYMLLRLLYGLRWSETEAPRALAAYCVYILLLAVNGILEAFVHAVAESRDISVGNAWLVACSLIHMGLAMLLVKPHGAVGLIAADAVNMVLRIAFCLAFVARHFRAVKGFRLQGLLPSRAAFAILAAASAVCLAADSILFKGAALPSALQEYIAADMSLAGVGFMARVAVHVGVGASSLGMVLLGLYRTEGDLLSGIRQMRKPTVS